MICIDQQSGAVTKEPLLTLARELKGRISFGVYLKQQSDQKLCTITSKSKVCTI